MGDQIVGFGDVASEDYHPSGVNEILPDGRILVWPIDVKGREKKWRYARQSVEQIRDNLKVKTIRDKYEIYFVKDVATVKTIWYDAKFDASEYGTKLLQQMFGSKQVDFSFPKSIYTLMETIYIATETESLILDYFAGSGTTGHAVINLNREDGGKRKFILVEMAHYFDTILLPRLKKVIFTPEWKDGKPKRMATLKEVDRSPRIIKVIRLESYEDTLNNLLFENPSSQKASDLFKENYPMHYILKWENCKSTICLNVEKFQNPFSYTIRLLRNGKNNEQLIDLPETFNYLIGLDVQTRRVYKDNNRYYLVYRGNLRNGRTVAIIWRETKGWSKADYERDRDFVINQKMTVGVDKIFVNDYSLIPGAHSLDLIFIEKMIK